MLISQLPVGWLDIPLETEAIVTKASTGLSATLASQYQYAGLIDHIPF